MVTQHSCPKNDVASGLPSAYLTETSDSIKAYGKYLVHFLETTVLYISGQLNECLKRLTAGFSKEISQNFVSFFNMNAAGCLHLKMNKPSLALLYFKKSLQASKDNHNELLKNGYSDSKRAENLSVNSKTSKVILNCALSHYKLGYYSLAWKLFEKISSDNLNNYLFWYRFGLSGLNWFIQESEVRSRKVESY